MFPRWRLTNVTHVHAEKLQTNPEAAQLRLNLSRHDYGFAVRGAERLCLSEKIVPKN